MRRLSLVIGFCSFVLGHPQAEAAPAAPAAAVEAVIDLSAGAAAQLRALGEVVVFTAAARPVRTIAELTRPETQVVIADLGLARGVMGLLRAGGVKFNGGAFSLARLTSEHHLTEVFRAGGPDGARLLVMRPRGASAQAALLGKGGARPVRFRGPGGAPIATAAADGANAAAPAAIPTSFGPLLRSTRADSARTRVFTPEEIRRPTLKAGPGKTLLVVHIARDFGAGLGRVSFLYGSGIILEPDFSPLRLVVGNRRLAPVATHAEGPTLELIYEIPATARDLRLEDGTATWKLTPEAPPPRS